MKPAVRDSYAPCKKKYGALKKCKLCDRCKYHIKLHRNGIDFWRCVY